MGTSRALLVVVIVVSLALGACTRQQQRDRTAPLPSPTGTPTRDANDDTEPAQSSAHTIAIVPVSEDLLRRAASGGTTIRKILAAAKPTIGTPYKWAGTNLTTGIDCSNYTWLLYRSIGVPYERYIRTREMSTLRRNAGFAQATFADAQPGDLLVYGYRDADGDWHGHVVILVDKTGRDTGHKGLVLGAHGTPVSAVQFVIANGFDQGYFKIPEMRLLNVLRPSVSDAQ